MAMAWVLRSWCMPPARTCWRITCKDSGCTSPGASAVITITDSCPECKSKNGADFDIQVGRLDGCCTPHWHFHPATFVNALLYMICIHVTNLVWGKYVYATSLAFAPHTQKYRMSISADLDPM